MKFIQAFGLSLFVLFALFSPVSLWAASFQPVEIQVDEISTHAVAIGDVDGDGNLDAFVGNFAPSRVWLGDGAGNFVDSGQSLPANGLTRAVVLGDLDGDGDLDAFVGNNSGSQVLLNDGVGTFSDSGQSLGASATYALAIGDVDNDGDLDVVSGNDGQENRLWLNDGDGVFVDSGQALGGGFTIDIELADLDSDGDLDIFAGNFGTCTINCGVNNGIGNTVWLNDGSGTFVDSGQDLCCGNTNAVALGDLDGDGDLDAFTGNHTGNSSNGNRVWLNDGAGQFTDSGQILGDWDTFAVTLGDVDGDGDLDAIAGQIRDSFYVSDGAANRVWLNNGSGVFTDSGQSLGRSETEVVVLADLDGDGDLDIFEGNNRSANYVWLNDSNGTFFDGGQALGSSDSRDVALGDLDGDGDLDAFEANIYGYNRVWLNDGAFSFTDSSQALGDGVSYAVALGDLDGDGDLDAYTATASSAPDQVWLNDGNGIFFSNGQGFPNRTAISVALGDADGDGDLDAIVGTVQSNQVLMNDGAGNFGTSGQALGTGQSNVVAFGDVDGDGDLDIFTGGGSNRVWLNDGTGFYSDSGQVLGASRAGDADLGDVDGDGDLDIFTANITPNANQVWLNDGAGVFSDSGQALGNTSSSGVSLGDVDLDGDLDAFVANGGRNRTWLNDGGGIFTANQTLLLDTSTSVELGDLNGDGDLDAFVSNDRSANRVFRNIRAPYLATAPLAEVVAGFVYDDQLDVAVESGVLVLASSVLPAWMTFDDMTGRLSGTPLVNQTGANPVSISADDSFQVADLSFSVNVLPNLPPTFTSTPALSVDVDTAYQYQVTVDDDYNFTLLAGIPAWLTFDPVTAILSGTPADGDVGDHVITLRATDEAQLVEQTFTLSVLTNLPPTFTSTPSLSVREGSGYQYAVTVDDDFSFTLSAVTIPTWLTFDAQTGMLSGTPAASDVGSHSVELRATDEVQSVEQTFAVIVTAIPPPPPAPAPAPAAASGGGGSMGLFLLFLLGFCAVRRRT